MRSEHTHSLDILSENLIKMSLVFNSFNIKQFFHSLEQLLFTLCTKYLGGLKTHIHVVCFLRLPVTIVIILNTSLHFKVAIFFHHLHPSWVALLIGCLLQIFWKALKVRVNAARIKIRHCSHAFFPKECCAWIGFSGFTFTSRFRSLDIA